MRTLAPAIAACFFQTIAGSAAAAEQWTHIENMAGATGCAARLSGDEVDTMLMINRAGQLVLVAGRADWHASGPEEISLRIDDFGLSHLSATAFNNLVLLQITDEAILQRLRLAKDLYWSMPSGNYHAGVAGLGEALDWVHRCDERKHLSTGDETAPVDRVLRERPDRIHQSTVRATMFLCGHAIPGTALRRM